MEELLDRYNLTYATVNLKSIIEETATVAFQIEFSTLSNQEVSILSEVQTSLLTSATFGRFMTELSQSQVYALKVASEL